MRSGVYWSCNLGLATNLVGAEEVKLRPIRNALIIGG
jgi:hypothetical protein